MKDCIYNLQFPEIRADIIAKVVLKAEKNAVKDVGVLLENDVFKATFAVVYNPQSEKWVYLMDNECYLFKDLWDKMT